MDFLFSKKGFRFFLLFSNCTNLAAALRESEQSDWNVQIICTRCTIQSYAVDPYIAIQTAICESKHNFLSPYTHTRIWYTLHLLRDFPREDVHLRSINNIGKTMREKRRMYITHRQKDGQEQTRDDKKSHMSYSHQKGISTLQNFHSSTSALSLWYI